MDELRAIEISRNKWQHILEQLDDDWTDLKEIPFGIDCGYCMMAEEKWIDSITEYHRKCECCPVEKDCDIFMSDIYAIRSDGRYTEDEKRVLLYEQVDQILDFLFQREEGLNE